MKIFTPIFFAAFVGATGVAWAGQLEDASTASRRGDYPSALMSWRPLAEQGNAEAQNQLGVAYADGKGVPADYAESVKWFRLAAEQGLAVAQGNLGWMYQIGRGVSTATSDQLSLNRVLAHMWFNLASSGGADFAKKRNDIEARMLPTEIIQAQNMAKSCLASTYKQCDRPARAESAVPPSITPAPTQIAKKSKKPLASALSVPLQQQGGTFTVPVHINGAITLNFVVDSGAADVSIPSDVVATLMRTGTLKKADFLGQRTYVLADGSKVLSQTFRIRSMKVGDRVVENVTGSVASTEGMLLLGQSFLGRFKSWSIDNTNHVLLLE